MRPLPIELVDTIWARLTAFYGRRFMLQFEGIEDLASVKSTWGEALAVFGRQHWDGTESSIVYPAIDYALESANLPVEPPTLPLLREICRAWREPDRPRLADDRKPQLSNETRDLIARGLSARIPDDRPQRVRAASAYVARHGAPGLKLSPRQAADLTFFRKILDDYNASLCRDREAQPE